jgi:hypothetical protein
MPSDVHKTDLRKPHIVVADDSDGLDRLEDEIVSRYGDATKSWSVHPH